MNMPYTTNQSGVIDSAERERRLAAWNSLEDNALKTASKDWLRRDITGKELTGVPSDYGPTRALWNGTTFEWNPAYLTYQQGAAAPSGTQSPSSPSGGAGTPAAGGAAGTPTAGGSTSPTGGGTTASGGTGVSTPSGGMVASSMNMQGLTPQQIQQYNPFGNLSPSLDYQATTAPVDAATQTTQGQLLSLLDPSHPLYERSMALSRGAMGGRGVQNSTMAGQAGVAAFMDRVTPIAAQDASIYSDRAMFNADAENQGGMFRASETNKLVGQGADIASRFGLQANEFEFTSGENAADRASREALANAQLRHDAAMTNLRIAAEAANTDKSIAAQMKLQEAQQEFAGTQAELDRAQQLVVQGQQQQFQESQNAMDRAQQENLLAIQQAFTGQENALDRENQRALMELQNSINSANVPKAATTEIVTNLARDISTIAASPDMDAAAKDAQIRNLYDAANAGIQTLSTLYNTPLTGVGDTGTVVPGGTTTSPPVTNATGYPSGLTPEQIAAAVASQGNTVV